MLTSRILSLVPGRGTAGITRRGSGTRVSWPRRHGAVAVSVVAEREAEEIVEDLDGDEATGPETWVRQAIARPEQVVEPGGEAIVVPALSVLELWAPLTVVKSIPEARFPAEELRRQVHSLCWLTGRLLADREAFPG